MFFNLVRRYLKTDRNLPELTITLKNVPLNNRMQIPENNPVSRFKKAIVKHQFILQPVILSIFYSVLNCKNCLKTIVIIVIIIKLL